MMEKLIDISVAPVASVLDVLLQDKTSGGNIIWATDTYANLGEGFAPEDEMQKDLLLQHPDIIRPRIQKPHSAQAARTRSKAEVFTPAWLCNRMNNFCDEDWFGRKDVFNTEHPDHTWTETDEPVTFPDGKTWQEYVDSRRLEITCGEAPFIVSRYDVATGNPISPILRRIGQLDRKLRIVNENTAEPDEWLEWALRAYESTYAYEYQGDNLLIARVNLLLTFVDWCKWHNVGEPDGKLLRKVADIISWNAWQMDGLQNTPPLRKQYDDSSEVTLFDEPEEGEPLLDEAPRIQFCKIYSWRRKRSFRFTDLKRK